MKLFFFVMAFAISLNTQAQTLRERLGGFSAGAHQGGVYNFTPNTLKRFKIAKKQGVDIIELDLRETRDGHVVVFHNETLNSSTTCKGRIVDHTLSELKKCSFELNREKIPSFDEVLEWANGEIVINAEFKTREVIAPALELLKRHNAYEWVFFQTKADPERYYRARAIDKNAYLLFAPKDEADLEWALDLDDDRLLVIELHKNLRRADVIGRIHAAGKLALEDSWRYVWHKEVLEAACKKVFTLGIDIAITNNPKSCAKQREQFEQAYVTGGLGFRPGKNFHEVVPGEFYRSAQLTGKEFEAAIKDHGIKTIINLRGEKPGSDWFENEVAAAEKHGVQLVSIGMRASRIPHRQDLIKLLDVYANAPRPILVHCQGGADRTGEATAIYAMEYMGWSRKRALKMLTLKYYHFRVFTPAKSYFIRNVYNGETWARTEYDPCAADYKYYDKSKLCRGNQNFTQSLVTKSFEKSF